jgi:hypothetical protein
MEEETRVRGNFTQTAKGIAQLDCTAEASTPEKMKELLSQCVGIVIEECHKRKIPVSHEVEVTTKVEKETKEGK